jgi:hypothetical protein
LDYFEVILGQGFVRRTKVVLMPFEDKLVILDGWKNCVEAHNDEEERHKCVVGLCNKHE